MAKVKIKTTNPKEERKKLKLLEILSRNDVYATRIITIADGFVTITNEESDLDKIFDGKTDQQLIRDGFTPMIPPELKAQRSIKIFNVENTIYDHDTEEMITEIMERNPFTNNQIQEIEKPPRSKMLKITFTTTNIAKKAAEQGLKMYLMSIPPHQIEQDKFIEIKTCYRCYKVEDHFTSDCPKPKEYKICSECGEEGHYWRECNNTIKKCINCQEEHRTLAMRCPRRREAYNFKKTESKTTTYSNVVSRTTLQQHQQGTFYNREMSAVTPDIQKTIFACLMHAHIINAEKPGSYQDTINKVFPANGLPAIVIPEDPPSKSIMQSLMSSTQKEVGKTSSEAQQRDQGERMEDEPATHSKKPEESATHSKKTEESTKHKSKSKEKKRKELLNSSSISSSDIGLKIYSASSRGWPEGKITKENLIKGIDENIYKWTFTNKALKDDDVLGKIIFNQIETEDCYVTLEDGIFNKLTSGLTDEDSPIKQKCKRHRTSSR